LIDWQDTEHSISRYVSVAIEFLTAMKNRLYHIGSSYALQVGKWTRWLPSCPLIYVVAWMSQLMPG